MVPAWHLSAQAPESDTGVSASTLSSLAHVGVWSLLVQLEVRQAQVRAMGHAALLRLVCRCKLTVGQHGPGLAPECAGTGVRHGRVGVDAVVAGTRGSLVAARAA